MTNPFNEAKSDHQAELAALRQRAEIAELEAMRQRAELAEHKLELLEQRSETKQQGRISRVFRFSAKVWLGWLFFHVVFTLFMVLLLVGAAFVFGAGSTVDKFDQVNIEIGGDASLPTTSTTEPCAGSGLRCVLDLDTVSAETRISSEEWERL